MHRNIENIKQILRWKVCGMKIRFPRQSFECEKAGKCEA